MDLRRRLSGLAARLGLLLAVLGPGMITSNVDNDAGGIYTYSVAGARHGYELLLRDVEHLCDYFTHCGVRTDGRRFADGLWHRFSHDRLRPEGFPVPV